MMSISQNRAVSLPGATCVPRSRPSVARPSVLVRSRTEGSANKGHSGVHDPLGWGQRGGAVKPHEAGLEQQRHLSADHLAAEEQRKAARPGAVGVDRHEAATREILEVEKEKAEFQNDAKRDDEWAHMSAPQKWFMEAKALLYSWLGTGVEPL